MTRIVTVSPAAAAYTSSGCAAHVCSVRGLSSSGCASINPTTGVFTWMPTEAQGAGTFTFDVVVTDNGTPAPDK